MMYMYFILGIGLFFVTVVFIGLGLTALFAYFADSLETGGSGASRKATLTCFHCGVETPAGERLCRHCGGELQ